MQSVPSSISRNICSEFDILISSTILSQDTFRNLEDHNKRAAYYNSFCLLAGLALLAKMWLIDTSSLLLKKFSSFSLPFPYAILSHTWGPDEDEVSFQEMKEVPKSSLTTGKPGFRKISKTCELARTIHGLKYAWVDTCCIDKTSSSELTEAINSMFTWYQRSAACFIWLSDLESNNGSMHDCKWFTRGWTLQELIAPTEVVFYDKTWRDRGNKRDLSAEIARISGVSSRILIGNQNLDEIPVAVRMSWAARRETTRIEDLAYCLLGIFNVNMPMLYGEGQKAFIRLQEEIIKENPDMSIFAWKAIPNITVNYTGLLAESPVQFGTASNLVAQQDAIFDVQDFSITNQGIKLEVPVTWDPQTGYLILPVNHSPSGHTDEEYSQGVCLRQVGPKSFVRALPDHFEPVLTRGELNAVQVVKTLAPHEAAAIDTFIMHIQLPQDTNHPDFRLSRVEPRGCWDPSQNMLFAGHSGSFLGYMFFRPEWADEFDNFALICRFDRSRISEVPWRFDLMRGDEWLDTEFKRLERSGYNSAAFRNPITERRLALCHLYDESKGKVVTVRLSDTDINGRIIQCLSMHVQDTDSNDNRH